MGHVEYSWAKNQQYTPNQDKILASLNGQLEDGTYFLPTVAPGASAEDEAVARTSAMGKPWAVISYHKSFDMNMPMNLIRGFAADLLALFILCWLLLKIERPDFKTILLACISIGLINYLAEDYNFSIWFDTNTFPDLIDYIVQWALVGAWLGFFLTD